MSNYRSTIGGAFAATGGLILGGGLLTGYLEVLPKGFVVGLYITGIVCMVTGTFCATLFSADAKTVSNLQTQVKANSEKISAVAGDTARLTKESEQMKG
jgi:hypothetical protein